MYIVLFCKFTQGGIGATIIFRLQIDAIIIVAILFKVELLISGGCLKNGLTPNVLNDNFYVLDAIA